VIFDRILSPRAHSRTITTEELGRILARRSTSAAGVSVTPERAMALSAVFSCVRVLAESVGQMPLHLYEQRGREKTKAVNHPLYDVLHFAPNKYQTSQEWREWVMACLGLRGNAYSQIIRTGPANKLRVSELIPLPPESVTPVLDSVAGEVAYRVALRGGGSETLPASDVLHIKLMPLDGVMGANPVAHARESIGLAIGAEEFGAKLFANGAQPGGVLEHPGKLSEPAYKRILGSFEDRHQGSDKAHKVAILEEGMKWQSIGFPASDAQFLETRKYQRSEIAGLYGVPPHLIGDLERATFSNIEHQGLAFVTLSLMPHLKRFEERIAFQLLTPEERRRYFAKFNVVGLLRGDMAARSAFYNQLVNLGALSPNEVRDLEDMNPRDGGDIYLTPLNMAVNGKSPAE
jgi:HK97 family phage portal protein